MTIRTCTTADAAAIAEIYNYHVRETIVTFEETPVSAEEMGRRIGEVVARFPWLVYEDGGAVVAYAYAAEWKTRSAYRFCVESTIYVDPSRQRRGLGAELYGALLGELRGRGVHAVLGGIALPNAASVALHEKLGFEKIGHFAEVGFKLGRWIDVGYWQRLLSARA